MAEEESLEDWNDERCLSYDWCTEYADEKILYCPDCGHKQYAVELDWLY